MDDSKRAEPKSLCSCLNTRTFLLLFLDLVLDLYPLQIWFGCWTNPVESGLCRVVIVMVNHILQEVELRLIRGRKLEPMAWNWGWLDYGCFNRAKSKSLFGDLNSWTSLLLYLDLMLRLYPMDCFLKSSLDAVPQPLHCTLEYFLRSILSVAQNHLQSTPNLQTWESAIVINHLLSHELVLHIGIFFQTTYYVRLQLGHHLNSILPKYCTHIKIVEEQTILQINEIPVLVIAEWYFSISQAGDSDLNAQD